MTSEQEKKIEDAAFDAAMQNIIASHRLAKRSIEAVDADHIAKCAEGARIHAQTAECLLEIVRPCYR